MRNNTPSIICLLSLIVFAGGCGHTVALLNSSAVPAAKGHFEVSSDANDNTVVSMTVEHLAKATHLSPPRETYLVWVETPYSGAQRLGQLLIGDSLQGQFTGTFYAKKFRLLVTAEDSPENTAAGQQVIFSTEEVVR